MNNNNLEKLIYNSSNDNFINQRNKLFVLSYLYSKYHDKKYMDKAEQIINKILLYKNYYYDGSLWYGLSGILLILNSFKVDNFCDEIKRILENILIVNLSEIIDKYLRAMNYRDMDMFSGFIGIIQVLINTKNNDITHNLHKEILRISNLIIKEQGNLCNLFIINKKGYPNETDDMRYYDYSFAHGATSYLQILYLSYKKYNTDCIYNAIIILFNFIFININTKQVVKGSEVRLPLICDEADERKDGYEKIFYWCSGQLNVLNILLNINEDFKIVDNNLLCSKVRKVVSYCKKEWLPKNKFVCHGTSGTLLVLYLLKKNKMVNIESEKMIHIIKEYEMENSLVEYENNKLCILTGIASCELANEIISGSENDLYLKMLLLT